MEENFGIRYLFVHSFKIKNKLMLEISLFNFMNCSHFMKWTKIETNYLKNERRKDSARYKFNSFKTQ